MEVKVTGEAKEKLGEVIKQSKLKEPALRIIVAGMGWGGPRLGLTLDESKENKDNQIDADGLKILFDEQVKMAVDNGKSVTIDYIESQNGSGFTIDTGASCGCDCDC